MGEIKFSVVFQHLEPPSVFPFHKTAVFPRGLKPWGLQRRRQLQPAMWEPCHLSLRAKLQ